jgi:serine-type D-Ala-D-Ala carboxypeptidase/endopeptidase (penicillin-binding protein 4)
MLKNIFSQIWFLVPFLLHAQSGRDLERILTGLPQGTQYSVLVMDAERKQVLFDRNSLLPLKPASSIKVFTTGIPLLCLGNDFRITTSVYFNKAKIRNGILNDNLYLKGFGNAQLTPDDLFNLVKEIQKEGIREIQGSIVYDNSFFKKVVSGLNRSEFLSPLMLQTVSPISISKNIIEIVVSRKGSQIEVKSFPSSKYIIISNNICVSAGTNKFSAILEENTREFKIALTGNIRESGEQRIYLFVKKPELMASLLLQGMLENSGIIFSGFSQQGFVPTADMTEISSFVQMKEFIKEINKNSNNFFAETLKNFFIHYYNNIQSTNNEKNSIYSFLKSKGINTQNLLFADGSGISDKNKITTGSLVNILLSVYDNKEIYETFKNSLSGAGLDGTLKERFFYSVVKNNFWGKSGYLNGISSLCGYLRTASAKNIIIAIMFNFKIKGIDFYRSIEREIIETVFKKN